MDQGIRVPIKKYQFPMGKVKQMFSRIRVFTTTVSIPYGKGKGNAITKGIWKHIRINSLWER